MRRVLAALSVLALVVAWTRAPLLVARARPRAQFGQGRPVLSPHETTDATVDGAMLSISYGRPSVRGRTIFGSLVPYGRVWCPGADACTRLTTDRDLAFGGTVLRAGSYTLWMLPTSKAWTLILNSQANAFHTGRNPALDVAKVELRKETLRSPVEQLTFAIEKDPRGAGGVLEMSWATTRVAAPFSVAR
jgi:hypothetical protein